MLCTRAEQVSRKQAQRTPFPQMVPRRPVCRPQAKAAGMQRAHQGQLGWRVRLWRLPAAASMARSAVARARLTSTDVCVISPQPTWTKLHPPPRGPAWRKRHSKHALWNNAGSPPQPRHAAGQGAVTRQHSALQAASGAAGPAHPRCAGCRCACCRYVPLWQARCRPSAPAHTVPCTQCSLIARPVQRICKL